MCSLNEEDLDTLPKFDVSDKPLPNHCRKCNAQGSIILRKKDVFCNSCFTASVNHKFRASLGKNKTIRAHQKVAVALSGGLASSVLSSFVHNGLSEITHKKLHIDAVCIYIDESLSEADYKNNCRFILNECTKFSLPLYISHTGHIFIEDTAVIAPDTIPELEPDFFQKYIKIQELSSSTSVLDFRKKLLRNVLLHIAHQLHCSFILSGEISTTLASTMLTNLTLGRGAQIQHDIGFCDNRDSIRILRPIKDLTFEEVKIYADLKNISYLIKEPTLPLTIQFTIEKFVMNLQENFPATISTVCKTGEKMGDSSNNLQDTREKCVLCQSTVDTQAEKCSALSATELSRRISSPPDSEVAASQTTPDKACNSCKKPLAGAQIEKSLCYGCRLILRDVKDKNILTHVLDISKRRTALSEMKKHIKDFLL